MKQIQYLVIAWMLIALSILATGCEPLDENGCNCGTVINTFATTGPIPQYGAVVESWCSGVLRTKEIGYSSYLYTTPGDVECFDTSW